LPFCHESNEKWPLVSVFKWQSGVSADSFAPGPARRRPLQPPLSHSIFVRSSNFKQLGEGLWPQ
jgi:hypothetical protein